MKRYTFDIETLKSRLGAAAGFVTRKADSLTGLAKANVAIFQEEDKIKKAEAELGRLYYSSYISGEEADASAFQEICDRITASRVLVEGLKAEISDLKAKDQAEVIVEEDEITEEDFVIPGEEAAEEAPAEEAPAEETPEEEAPAEEEKPAE